MSAFDKILCEDLNNEFIVDIMTDKDVEMVDSLINTDPEDEYVEYDPQEIMDDIDMDLAYEEEDDF